MSRPEPLARTTVGVVVERRKAKSPWIDFVWRPIAALPGAPETRPWTVLEGDEETRQIYVGTAEIGLYRTDTAQYRDNLASGSPGLWVVLRPTEAGPPFEVVAVTANPSEGEAFTESGADLVEPVPMPESVRDLVEAFVAEHYVEQGFSKRRRQRADPDALSRRRPAEPHRPGKDGKS